MNRRAFFKRTVGAAFLAAFPWNPLGENEWVITPAITRDVFKVDPLDYTVGRGTIAVYDMVTGKMTFCTPNFKATP